MEQWAEKVITFPEPPVLEDFDFEAQHFPSRATTIFDGPFSRTPSVSTASTEKPQIPQWPAWKGYVALLGGFCQQILCWGMIMTFGTILAFYSRHLMPGVSKRGLSVLGALPPFCLLSLALLWGRLLDAGHHAHLNVIAGVCITGGFLGMAFTGGNGGFGDGKYWAILLAAIPVGIGQSIYFLAAPHMAKTWYPKHKGLAMGFTNSGAAVGGSLFPIAFTEITQHRSFRGAVLSLAGISCGLAIFIWYASRPAPSFERRNIGQKSSFETWWPKRAFLSWTFRIHVAAMCLVYLGILTVPFFIEVWAQRHHLGISEDSRKGTGINDKEGFLTVYLVVVLNACQLPGRWLGSTACDYIKARKIHCVASLAIGVLTIPAWLYSKYFASAATFAGLFGFLLGIMVSLPVNDAQEILGNKRANLFGQYSGVVYTCASPFILSGTIIAGAIIDNVGAIEAGIWAGSVFLGGGVLIGLSLVVPDDTWKFDKPKSNSVSSARTIDAGRQASLI